jgi:hypothetical protein
VEQSGGEDVVSDVVDAHDGFEAVVAQRVLRLDACVGDDDVKSILSLHKLPRSACGAGDGLELKLQELELGVAANGFLDLGNGFESSALGLGCDGNFGAGTSEGKGGAVAHEVGSAGDDGDIASEEGDLVN